MKILNKTVTVALAMTALLSMAGCSSSDDSGSGGGSGGSPLAVGKFVKKVYDLNNGGGASFFKESDYMKTQQLYLATDIKGSGIIKEISIVSSSDEFVDTICPDVKIKMAHTYLTELTDVFEDNVPGSLVTVKENTKVTFLAGDKGVIHTFKLDQPFEYNGVNNLIVEFERNSACSNYMLHAMTNMPKVSSVWTFASGGTVSTGLWHLNMIFGFEGGVNVQGEEGTVKGNTFPFDNLLKRTQHLYTASDINGSGPITGIAFQMSGSSTEAEYNATVRLGHTTLTAIHVGDKYMDNYTEAPTIVADSMRFTIPAGLSEGDWFWVPLSGTFEYNGIDNLLVDVEITAATGINRVQFVDNNGPDIRAYGNTGDDIPTGVDSYRYHMKFRFNGATLDTFKVPCSRSGIPFNTNADGSKLNSIYPSTELGTSGDITSVFLQLQSDSVNSTYRHFKVLLLHTDLNELLPVFADTADEAVEVFNGDYKIPAGLKVGDWLEIPLQKRFKYDVAKNLILQLQSDAGSADQPIGVSTAANVRVIIAWDSGTSVVDQGNNLFVNLRLKIEK